MKYPYAVKLNGKWYRPNTEVPEEKEVSAKAVTETVPTHPPDEKKGGKAKK